MNVVRSKFDHWCEGVIEAGWLAVLILAPMFFNVFSSRVFEPDKGSLVRSVGLVMIIAWARSQMVGLCGYQLIHQPQTTSRKSRSGNKRAKCHSLYQWRCSSLPI